MNRTPKYTVEYTIAVIAKTHQDFVIWKLDWVKDKSVSDTQYTFIVNEIKYIYVASADRLRGTHIDGIVEIDGAKYGKNYQKIINTIQYSMI